MLAIRRILEHLDLRPPHGARTGARARADTPHAAPALVDRRFNGLLVPVDQTEDKHNELILPDGRRP